MGMAMGTSVDGTVDQVPRHAVAANRVLLVLAGLAALLVFGTDALLTRSAWFGVIAEDWGSGRLLEAEARLQKASAGDWDVLFIGSSVAATNIDAETVEHGLHLRPGAVAKVDVAGAVALEFAMYSRELVRLRPRALVYVFTAGTVTFDIEWDLVRPYDPSVALELFSLPELVAGREFHAGGLLRAANVLIRHRADLRYGAVGVITRGRGPALWREERMRWISHVPELPNVNTRALALLARRAIEADIAVVLASSPLGRENRVQRETRLAAESYLAELGEQRGFRVVAAGDVQLRLAADLWDDRLHLGREGARIFSESLVPALAEALLTKPPQ